MRSGEFLILVVFVATLISVEGAPQEEDEAAAAFVAQSADFRDARQTSSFKHNMRRRSLKELMMIRKYVQDELEEVNRAIRWKSNFRAQAADDGNDYGEDDDYGDE
ncbi:uncharacterized protein LOC132706520 isoform X2 [Cylas formicarius]|uniref:uncharacterized protein LOC132706520 isoform X2 n=1 Tax=Cylas formicarius TaxID=197179 RepID=UPI002958963B|nr:uncharacterized protein LOC132706520 isoform X2 [Cylas formicarius]